MEQVEQVEHAIFRWSSGALVLIFMRVRGVSNDKIARYSFDVSNGLYFLTSALIVGLIPVFRVGSRPAVIHRTKLGVFTGVIVFESSRVAIDDGHA